MKQTTYLSLTTRLCKMIAAFTLFVLVHSYIHANEPAQDVDTSAIMSSAHDAMYDDGDHSPISLGVDYTAEVHTHFKGNYNFVNLLRLNMSATISDRLAIKAGTISVFKTKDTYILDDLQGFSNIDSDRLLLGLSMLGAEWQIDDNNLLFAGIRCMNEDYFTSPVTSLYTNSSCGIYPTIAANYPIANYPFASVGIHYTYDNDRLGVQASVYNGKGYNRFAGHDNVFHFKPNRDGIFSLAQAEYKVGENRYFLGGCVHYGRPYEEAQEKVCTTLWTYGEQQLSPTFALMAGYSHAFAHDGDCKDFAALALKADIKGMEWGLLTDYAKYSVGEEWATELTCKTAIGKYCYLQPTVHFINNAGGSHVAALLRFGLSL